MTVHCSNGRRPKDLLTKELQSPNFRKQELVFFVFILAYSPLMESEVQVAGLLVQMIKSLKILNSKLPKKGVSETSITFSTPLL